MTQKKSELLMPAGSLEKLKTAVIYGADAVYMGTPDLSLRTNSKLSLDDVVEGIEFAHAHGVRVYLTLNLFSHNKDIPKLDAYINTVRRVKPDGLIIADPGVFAYVKEQAPELNLHISTQANVCSWLSTKFWQDQGAELVVLAREVTYTELCEIRERCPDVKLEAFVHGSMCMTYSGRCLLSNFMSERGANQGNCANSCRWNYKLHMKLKDGTLKEIELNEDNKELFEFFLEEGYREGDLLPFEEGERGSYILNSRDLCLLPNLDDYLKIGIDSLKVEGRGRSAFYAGIVARAYRSAIDDWYKDPENFDGNKYMEDINTIPNRGYTFAFHEGRLTNHAHSYQDTRNVGDWQWAGQITEVTDDAYIMLVKNKMEKGDVLEFIPPHSKQTMFLRIYEFIDAKKGENLDVVHAGQQRHIRIPFAWFTHEDPEFVKNAMPAYSLVRKEVAMTDRNYQRLKLDRISYNVERGINSENLYKKQSEKLESAIDLDDQSAMRNPPRIGTEGCCGRGCNGCLIFWNDPKYAKAREMMANKKQGEMLTESQGKLFRNATNKT
ncbi:MAG: U32 family peptidase C-terminal domain-containing protein [Alphaproteobacteria bacterium]